MPNLAFLDCSLYCDQCSVLVTTTVAFGWGYCPAATPRFLYHLGDEIRWRRCVDGSIRPWTYFTDVGKVWEANIGDPDVANLITRDTFSWYNSGDNASRLRCSNCGSPIGGAAVEIREGRIVRAWLYRPGEFSNDVDDYLILTSGELQPKPEWNDHSMHQIPSC